jgi:hypothetical protein
MKYTLTVAVIMIIILLIPTYRVLIEISKFEKNTERRFKCTKSNSIIETVNLVDWSTIQLKLELYDMNDSTRRWSGFTNVEWLGFGKISSYFIFGVG